MRRVWTTWPLGTGTGRRRLTTAPDIPAHRKPTAFPPSGPGNVLVVTIAKPGTPAAVETVPVSCFLWRSETVEVRCAEDVDALRKRISELAPQPARYLLPLTLSRAVGLATRARLRKCREDWGASLHHLDVQDHGLADEPSDDDLDCIDRGRPCSD